MSSYNVRYKAIIEHRDLSAQRLVELVRGGQISGVHSYSRADSTQWRPVFAMEYSLSQNGDWSIDDPKTPEPIPALAEKSPATPAASAAPFGTPQVVVYQNVPGTPQPHSSPHPQAASGDPAISLHSTTSAPTSKGGAFSLTGFILGIVGVVLFVLTAIPVMRVYYTGIVPMLAAITAVVFSACGMAGGRRRGMAITGLVTGICAVLAWITFFILVTRSAGE